MWYLPKLSVTYFLNVYLKKSDFVLGSFHFRCLIVFSNYFDNLYFSQWNTYLNIRIFRIFEHLIWM